jgi:LmbE family N-acetylglucosaminyl deacetylase
MLCGMAATLRLLAVLAHPDDESLGVGGTLARYADEGVQTHLLTATRGERGRFFLNDDRPDDVEVGRVRERELHAAAGELGLHSVEILGYGDGALDRAPATEATARVATHIRRVRPDVVISFGFDGAYGHPDHIAISQITTAAIILAADHRHAGGESPHRVAKLYHLGWPARIWDLYQSVFKRLVSVVDGVERAVNPWPEWMLTTRVDARDYWQVAWRAVQQHRTQLAMYGPLSELAPEQHRTLWGDQHFCRVFSTVNGGRRIETDLFEGLR